MYFVSCYRGLIDFPQQPAIFFHPLIIIHEIFDSFNRYSINDTFENDYKLVSKRERERERERLDKSVSFIFLNSTAFHAIFNLREKKLLCFYSCNTKREIYL